VTSSRVLLSKYITYDNFFWFWQKETSEHENYAPYYLMNEEGSRFFEPVTVPGVPGALERANVLQKIKGKTNLALLI